MDLDAIKRTGIAAAYRGGEVLRSWLGKISKVEKKGDIDLVTEADTASEAAIVEIIRSRYPDHGLLAEEGGSDPGKGEGVWVIDPLDGTTNFAHQLGLFCVSIGYVVNDEPRVGIVFDPLSGELFTAVSGAGAELNGRPVHVSNTRRLSDSLLVTGFPYNQRQILPRLMARFTRCLEAAQGIRRLGSAALDLCYVACGRFDAFWEENLKPWDTAAGALIAREAGAAVTDFSDRPYGLKRPEILASNGWIHREMISRLKIEEDTCTRNS